MKKREEDDWIKILPAGQDGPPGELQLRLDGNSLSLFQVKQGKKKVSNTMVIDNLPDDVVYPINRGKGQLRWRD